MRKKILTALILFAAGTLTMYQFPQDDYLKISVNVDPQKIKQGNEGSLKIKITPKPGIKISSYPEFMIKLDKNNNLSFSKLFFTASELDLQTKQENGTVLLELEKEVDIKFKVHEDSLIGKHKISGEVVFTAVSKDNWALKTYQKFNADFISRRNRNIKPKRK
jgi:hypothetical protein